MPTKTSAPARTVGVAEGLVVTTSLLGESTRGGANQAIGLTPKGSAPATANEIQYIQTLATAFLVACHTAP